MANQSIYDAFERMWHHVVVKIDEMISGTPRISDTYKGQGSSMVAGLHGYLTEHDGTLIKLKAENLSELISILDKNGTTSESGNMVLGGITGAEHMVLGVSCTSMNAVLHPWLSNNGNWYVHATNVSTNENIVNTELDVKVAYININL